MSVEGVDYAFSQPDPAQLYAAGKRFAMRYVGPGTDDKRLHADERDQIWAAGLSIVLLAEGAADSAMSGLPLGRAHASAASTDAQFLGAPDSLPIYFAVDFDVTSSQWSAVANYLRGAASVIGADRVGIYGSIRAMQWADRDSVAAWFFQTYAWSAGQWFGGNHVEQYHNGVVMAGGTVDLCRAKVDNFGQWEAHMASEWHTGDEDGPFLSQGNPGYAGQQRDTALAFAWQAAGEAKTAAEAAKAAADAANAKCDQILAKLEAGGTVPPHTHEVSGTAQ